jgi:methylmalonyl-CoA mutase cobalamin-binding subunit
MFMFKILERQVATIGSHRTALSAVLGTFDGHNVGSHLVISNLMRNFGEEDPS